nr:hypothetical protein [Tanacetum cinerariifolium]
MQQPMENPKDISDPTTAIDMALVLMAKAFTLNDTTLTNNNQISSSNPSNMQIAKPSMNINQDRQMLMVENNVGNQFRPNAVQNVRNQYGIRNVVTTRAEANGNGINGNQIRCYNCQGVDHYASNCTLKPRKRDAAYLQKQIVQNFEIQFLKEAAKFVRDFKSLAKEADESLVKHKALELEIERLLRAVVSERKDTTKGTSVNTQFCKQLVLGKPPSSSRSKLYYVTSFLKSKGLPKIDESHALSKPITSNLVTTPTKSKVMKNNNVNSLGIFRINPFKAYRIDNFMPNKHVKAIVRTKPITVSQPHVITKNDVNFKTNGFSPKDVKSTTRTRKPYPRNNPKNDKVPSKSKSSWLSNNLEKIEANHRNLQSFSNKKHMSSECNNIKLTIRNAKSEVVYTMCKQCLITINHDVCVLNYVNDMNSHALNKNANVSNVENQKKHKLKVKKPKKVGSKERLASPKPSTPRSCIRWSPTGRIFDLKGKIIYVSI